MNNRNYRTTYSLLALTLFLLACAVPSLATSVPVQKTDPQAAGALETVIAQTVVAAQTQTATLQPTVPDLADVTPTFTPSTTPTLPTSTPTFFFSLYTSTPGIFIETSDPSIAIESGGSTGSSTQASNPYPITKLEWSCAGNGWRNPGNGAQVSPGQNFSVYFTVTNNGTKTWTVNTIDFVHRGGFRHNGGMIQDIGSGVAPGGKLTVKVSFTAPKKEGEYRSNWALKVGNNSFCGISINFKVIK